MTTTAMDALAGIIRQVDGNNALSPTDLGWEIASKMPPFFLNGYGQALADFVERTNPDKRMGAGRLAELIVAEFRLDEEN
jgi:hypothetical protein